MATKREGTFRGQVHSQFGREKLLSLTKLLEYLAGLTASAFEKSFPSECQYVTGK